MATKPALNIPDSSHVVQVSIIDTTAYASNFPVAIFMQPHVAGYDKMSVPCYAFLIKHGSGDGDGKYDKILFDLGIRKDWQNSPPVTLANVGGDGMKVTVEKGVADVLRDQGEDPGKIGGIIWSHWHWDHTGDPSIFPSKTDLIVGPGFKGAFLPGYPSKQDSPVAASAWEGRELREIDFDKESNGLKLGRYRAMDFYGDGSFYLLDTPGHAVGHLCGLARTSTKPATFIFMGADIAHHGGQYRPSQYRPLPQEISPNPLYAPYSKQMPICPGALFEAVHPNKSSTEPYFRITQGETSVHDDPKECQESLDKLIEFDADENIFSVLAHDDTLSDVVDLFPKGANDWKAKGWATEARWRFLKDFDLGGDKASHPK